MTTDTLLTQSEPKQEPIHIRAMMAALIVGLSFDLLVWDARPGVGVAITGVVVVGFLARSLSPDLRIAIPAAMFFASVAWRASVTVQIFNMLFGLAATGLLVAQSTPDYDWRLRNVLRAFLSPWLEAVPRGLAYVGMSTPNVAPSRRYVPWLRGGILASSPSLTGSSPSI